MPGRIPDFEGSDKDDGRFLFPSFSFFPDPRIVFRSLDSMLSELPVDSFVMVTEPIAEPELVVAGAAVEFGVIVKDPGMSLFRTGEMVTLLSRLAANIFMVLSTLEL